MMKDIEGVFSNNNGEGTKLNRILEVIEAAPKHASNGINHLGSIDDIKLTLIDQPNGSQHLSIKDKFGNTIMMDRDKPLHRLLEVLVEGNLELDTNGVNLEGTNEVINKIEQDLYTQNSKGGTSIKTDTRGDISVGEHKLWLSTSTCHKTGNLQTMIKMYRSKSNVRLFLPKEDRNDRLVQELVDNIDKYS